MDANIAWEEFSSQGSKSVEEVRKGMTSINGKLDALLQLANESNINSARTAEIVPQVMGDTAEADAQAAEMAAMGGMPPGIPPEAMPPEEPPPEDSMSGDIAPVDEAEAGGAPLEEIAEGPATEVPPETINNEPTPSMDEGPSDLGPAPAGEVPPSEGEDMLAGIDWSAYSIDNAYEDFEEALKEEAKDALDAGDTARVTAITQAMDAIRLVWAQSGIASVGSEMPAEEPASIGIDGEPPVEMMKSESDEVTDDKIEDTMKAEETPIEGAEQSTEKAEDMSGDIAEGETSGGEAVESVEASEGCKKSESEEKEEPVESCTKSMYMQKLIDQGIPQAMVDRMMASVADQFDENGVLMDTAKSETSEEESMDEEAEDYAIQKSEGIAIPTFREMMEAKEFSDHPFDVVSSDEILRGARLGQVYKSENGTYMIMNSSKPNMASAVGIQAKVMPNEIEALQKSIHVPEMEEEADPIRKALDVEWENYMSYKHEDAYQW